MSQEQLPGRKFGHLHSTHIPLTEFLSTEFQDVTFTCSNSRGGIMRGPSASSIPLRGTPCRLLRRALMSGSITQLPYLETQNNRYLRYNTKYNAFGINGPPKLIVFISTFLMSKTISSFLTFSGKNFILWKIWKKNIRALMTQLQNYHLMSPYHFISLSHYLWKISTWFQSNIYKNNTIREVWLLSLCPHSLLFPL